MEKTLLAKVCKTYCNRNLSNDYSSSLSVINDIELGTEFEETCSGNKNSRKKKVTAVNPLSSFLRYVS